MAIDFGIKIEDNFFYIKGEEKGKAEGRAEEKINTLKRVVTNALENDMTYKQIQLFTNLTVEEIKEIEKEIKT